MLSLDRPLPSRIVLSESFESGVSIRQSFCSWPTVVFHEEHSGSISAIQRYFLNVVAVIATMIPSNAAEGSNTQFGFSDQGSDR